MNNTIMKTKIKKEINETIQYLKLNSLDNLNQILADPVNVIWEADIELDDKEYDEAIKYIENYRND